MSITALIAMAGIGAYARDKAIVLPVALPATVTEDKRNISGLIGRAGLLTAIEDRGIDVLSPGMTLVMKEETGLDFADPQIWDKERLQLIAKRWKVRYVAGVSVLELKSEEGTIKTAQGVPPPPGGTLETTIKLVGTLWDDKNNKFIFDHKEFTQTYSVGRPGPSDRQVESEQLQAISKASAKVFAEYLDKLPKVKRPAPKKGGGG